MSKSKQQSRREFLEIATAGTGLALTGSARKIWARELRDPFSAANASESARAAASPADGVNPFTDPAYAAGAKMRLGEFIARGADPNEAKAIFARLTSLDPETWVNAWTKLAVPFEQKGADLESQGKLPEANKAYEQAATYYSIAKFPVINHPAKQAAYRKCVENYLKAARSQDPPLERVAIPFEGKEIIGYLRKPKGVTRPPVVIATGGVDVYKEDRKVDDILGIGAASFSMDMPGAGECPMWNTPDAERLYVTTIDFLLTRQDLDAQRLGFIGRSYAGYWGAKMAYVEPKRIRASAQLGGPIHYTWQEDWLRGRQTEKTYFWSVLDSMIYSNHVKDYDELIRTAPAMSLLEQGFLEKPSAPMIMFNGEHDPWISPQEIHLLLEHGQPKTARLIADGAHLGRGSHDTPAVNRAVIEFLREHLKA
ncbi:MAG TPA: alpha/beta hydrolase [Candidatus Acidoferrales bacterium]|nr:alpha/beta hydrolase [Candidatus Acidoferrales bacterium]